MDEDKDMMITELRKNGLDNKEDDKVKAIVYPVYLNGMDDMINLNYYDTMAGCHMGIFPSYYEPWGYTPLDLAKIKGYDEIVDILEDKLDDKEV